MIKITCLLFYTFCLLFSQAQPQKIKPVIFDTDMGPDYDDVGAITLLHAFADSGKATILATIASTKYEGVAAVLNVLNTYFKKPTIPIGVPKGFAVMQKDWQHWTDTLIATYPHTIKTNDEVPDAVALYRKTLAHQANNSVTIITVGFLTNISHLLKSKPDKYSALPGKELVNKKVKELVCMAGKFPQGKEFNIEEDAKAAKYVFENWKKPLIFSGFEIGQKIKTGLPLVNNAEIQNSPIKKVFEICLPMAKEDHEGRMSWDQTAILVGLGGHSPYYGLQNGKILVKEDGSNTWIRDSAAHHYLVEKRPAGEVEALINNLMLHQPQ